MVLEIIQEGDERLTAENATVTDISEVTDLVEDLKETLLKANENGLGLAAPQVGINKKVLVMREGLASNITPVRFKPLFAMINPEIVKVMSKKGVCYREGCLSVENFTCDVLRHRDIKVRYMNEEGRTVTQRFSGIEAVVAQHEIDHLNQIVMTHPTRAIEMHTYDGMTLKHMPEEIAENPEVTEIK